MKYWIYFIAKMTAIIGVLSLTWKGLHAVWPTPEPFMRVHQDPFAHDLGYTFAVLFFGLFAVGLIYLAILDQRYRCRTCLRRLRMPVTHGGWNHVLLGPPRTEYICPWGHGTLRVSDLNIAGPGETDWHPIDDMWKELYELESTKK